MIEEELATALFLSLPLKLLVVLLTLRGIRVLQNVINVSMDGDDARLLAFTISISSLEIFWGVVLHHITLSCYLCYCLGIISHLI